MDDVDPGGDDKYSFIKQLQLQLCKINFDLLKYCLPAWKLIANLRRGHGLLFFSRNSILEELYDALIWALLFQLHWGRSILVTVVVAPAWVL